jgi:hypothetical protein
MYEVGGKMMRKRQKASDIFRETEPFFGRKVSFKEAFPEIKEIKVVCSEKGHGVDQYSSRRTYTLRSMPGEYVDCSNPLCYNGGFSLGQILSEMVSKRKAHFEGYQKCKGYEGSPKGRRKYRDCFNFWDITVDIVYHEEQTTEK